MSSETVVQKKFKVPRIPGDIMIYPMVVGILLNTFCPQVLEIGGFLTAATRGGANAIVAAILLFVGAGINFKSTPRAVVTGFAILIPKIVVAGCFGLFVAFFLNDNFLGMNSLAIIGGLTFCNMALYTGIMSEYGNETEQGAVAILFLSAGPVITMIILGVAGVADIPVGTIIGCVVPLVIGLVLGNLFPYCKQLLTPGVNPAIAMIGFLLGCNMSLTTFLTGGLSGILLGLIAVFVLGPITAACDKLCGGTGRAGLACSTIAGTAMTTPVALAKLSPAFAVMAESAYAQIATAVVVSALLAPIVTGWYDKKFCHKGDKVDEQVDTALKAQEAAPKSEACACTAAATSQTQPCEVPVEGTAPAEESACCAASDKEVCAEEVKPASAQESCACSTAEAKA